MSIHSRALQTVLLTTAMLLMGAAFTEAGSPATQTPATEIGKYTGPGSCSASSCHGDILPRDRTRVRQNEYSVWVERDKHAKAFASLSLPLSVRIATNLKLGEKPDASKRCLPCHALDVSSAARERTFDLLGGVSCESCHGPASGWLSQHFQTQPDWTAEQLREHHLESVKLGLYDTKDLTRRQERCLSCHLGSDKPNQIVDHELIAAGHPRLMFELDSYQDAMPRHWKQPLDRDWNVPPVPSTNAPDSWRDVRIWTVGQAVQLRQAMEHLKRQVNSNDWPDYSQYDCYSCHHALVKPENSWRLQLAENGSYYRKPDRQPGVIPANVAHFVVLRQILAVTDPAKAAEVTTQMKNLFDAASRLTPNRKEVEENATRTESLAISLAGEFENRAYDRATAVRLLHQLCGSSEEISLYGERTAEQALMGFQSVYLAVQANDHPGQDSRPMPAGISDLYRQLEDPSSYNADRFERQFRQLESLAP